ncbi:MAG: GNAT family N-acetyltransferase [Erysipelotrichaceae bacterium]|nr:GNAT family N-acetyltransferase [Erysipelotrichaceae bacterium]
MKTRKATLNDLNRMLEIEESAISGYGYLFENKEFYFDGIQNQGEMILAIEDELPVGMGQYSVLPDGSGWLEILRVHKDYQRKGAGRSIYQRYHELAKSTKAPSMAMFTGRRNIASKTLAELNGLQLKETHLEYSLDLSQSEGLMHDFKQIKNPDQLFNIFQKHPWGTFMGINRTFFHFNLPVCHWLCEKEMAYSDGENVVVLGARMLKHRGWYIGYIHGDIRKCIEFCIARTKKEHLSKLTVSLPETCPSFIPFFEEAGFVFNAELIVMEKQFTSLEKKD